MNYLHAFGIFTLVKMSLQIKLFLQNEPKFRKSQINVTDLLIRNYVQLDTWSIGKNEPKRTQNEPNFKKAKMNVTSYITKEYENKSNWAICENEPKQTQFKPKFSGKNMLNLTINTQPDPLGSYADEIEHDFSCQRIHGQGQKVPNY